MVICFATISRFLNYLLFVVFGLLFYLYRDGKINYGAGKTLENISSLTYSCSFFHFEKFPEVVNTKYTHLLIGFS